MKSASTSTSKWTRKHEHSSTEKTRRTSTTDSEEHGKRRAHGYKHQHEEDKHCDEEGTRRGDKHCSLSLSFSLFSHVLHTLSFTFSSLAPTSLLSLPFCSMCTLYPFILVHVYFSHSTGHITTTLNWNGSTLSRSAIYITYIGSCMIVTWHTCCVSLGIHACMPYD